MCKIIERMRTIESCAVNNRWNIPYVYSDHFSEGKSVQVSLIILRKLD